MLVAKNIQLCYQNKSIINDLSLQIPENKITALLGPNGCGKSTLLKAFARLLKPNKGQINYQNQNIWNKTPKEYSKILALLPQNHLVPEGITVKDLVAYGRSPHLNLWGKLSENDEQIVQNAMNLTKVTSLQNCLATDISGGQQQRAFLAMTIAQDAQIILLDEPTTYLDLNHQVELMTMIQNQKNQGKTIITVLHDLNQACRYCDNLVVLKEGKIKAQGSPNEIMTKELLEEVFEIDALIHQDPISNTPMFIVK